MMATVFLSSPSAAAALFLCASILILSISATGSSRSVHVYGKTKKHVPLFVFGDSLFDPGNNNYINMKSSSASARIGGGAKSWPYGETYFKKPTGRISDGRIVPDFIAEFLWIPLWTPYLQPGFQHNFRNGANFASGGAGVLNTTHPGTISLRQQLGYFKDVVKTLKEQVGEKETKSLVSKAIYFFSIGGNDYFDFHSSHRGASRPSQMEYVGIVTANLAQVLREIYGIGGRKIAFQNAGALGCVPINIAMNGGNCDEGLNAMARLHNYQLSNILGTLERNLPGFTYSIFDYYGAIYDRVTRPSKYGFKNGIAACCGGTKGRCGEGNYQVCSDPAEYVWFDGAHTTEACNWQLSKLMWKGKRDVISPYNLRQLYELNV